MITKAEYLKGNRYSLKSVADAAVKFGKVKAADLNAGAYKQVWMYDKAGKEVDWVNTYDKPKNGNCFFELRTAAISYIGMNYPIKPTNACVKVYSISAKSHSRDGQADTLVISGTDIAAFAEWYKAVDTKTMNEIEGERGRAVKPSL
jgi:hypothetical protein